MRPVSVCLAVLVASAFYSTGTRACSIVVGEAEFHRFLSTSSATLDSLGYRSLFELLSPVDAPDVVDPAVWLAQQLCPFDGQLTPRAKAALVKAGAPTLWPQQANATFHVYLLNTAPEFLSDIENKLQVFRGTLEAASTGKPENLEKAIQLILRVGGNAKQNAATIGADTPAKFFGEMNKK